eukprot:s2811_g2.t1
MADPFAGVLERSSAAQALRDARASLSRPMRPFTPASRSLFEGAGSSSSSSGLSPSTRALGALKPARDAFAPDRAKDSLFGMEESMASTRSSFGFAPAFQVISELEEPDLQLADVLEQGQAGVVIREGQAGETVFTPETRRKPESATAEYEGGGAEDLALRMDVPAGSDDSGSEDEAPGSVRGRAFAEPSVVDSAERFLADLGSSGAGRIRSDAAQLEWLGGLADRLVPLVEPSQGTGAPELFKAFTGISRGGIAARALPMSLWSKSAAASCSNCDGTPSALRPSVAMAVLKKLLNADMIGKLVEHPEQLDMPELIELSRNFFKMQAVVGGLAFLYGAFHSSMGLTTVGNFLMPLLGIYSTRDDNPDNYKCLRLCAMYWILGAIFSFFEAFLGFDLRKVTIGTLKTTVYGVQWLVLARLWRWLQVRYVGTVKFYLNVVIKNKKEVVRSQARERSRVAGKILGKIANHFLTDDAFSEKLAGNLEKSMPKRRGAGVVTIKFEAGVGSSSNSDTTSPIDGESNPGGEEQMKVFHRDVSLVACLAEFVGMTLFVIIGCGSAMGIQGSGSSGGSGGDGDSTSGETTSMIPGWVLMVALVFGLSITTLAYSIGHYSGDGDSTSGETTSMIPGWVLMVALVFGLSITTLAYSIGHYSGGHLNCAVTLGLVLTGNCHALQGLFNFGAQMMGSILGAAILCAIFPPELDMTKTLGANSVGLKWNWWNALIGELVGTFLLVFVVLQTACNPKSSMNRSQAGLKWNWWNALIGELVGTFLLVFVVLQTACNPKSSMNRSQACLAIGLAVFMAHCVLIPIDGCSINPTRSFGPALLSLSRMEAAKAVEPVATMVGEPALGEVVPKAAPEEEAAGPGYWRSMWIFWVGPLLGACLAAAVYKAMLMLDAVHEEHTSKHHPGYKRRQTLIEHGTTLSTPASRDPWS